MTNSHVVTITNITKNYPGVTALSDVSLAFAKAEIHAIVGENGAGKSTLMNILSGIIHPDSGEIAFEGTLTRLKDPSHAQSLGITMIHQELSLAPNMSVAENIFQGRMLKNALGFIDQNKMVTNTLESLSKLGVQHINPRIPVGHLSISEMQLVEIAKAISRNSKLLIMDEPTSSLSPTEISNLIRIITTLKNEGVSILFITHKLEEVMEVADQITVLRNGFHIETLDKSKTTIPEIISLMVGRSIQTQDYKQHREDYSNRRVVLEVRNLSAGRKTRNVSFKLHEGEILGVTGLVGAGRTELLNTLFGMSIISSGEILIHGKSTRIRHPATAIKLGIGLVPENRKEHGIFPRMSVRENMTIAYLKSLLNATLLISNTKSDNVCEKYITLLSIKISKLSQTITNLSGGNQQKAILARWLINQSQILLLDEPTHGVDVGAKLEIYQIISDLSQQGVSIILVSSEVKEVLSCSTRIMVMQNGTISGILPSAQADQETIIRLMFQETS